LRTPPADVALGIVAGTPAPWLVDDDAGCNVVSALHQWTSGVDANSGVE
jgi:hypothetical protein